MSLLELQNASYLAEKQGLGVVDAVVDALSKAGYNNQTNKKVMIQSSNSAVLIKLKEDKNNYEFVYEVEEDIRDALNSTILDITKFANSLVINKNSVFTKNIGFLTGATDVVSKLQAFKLPVYVQLFRNEFYSQAWDFFSDAYVELNSFVAGAGIDGVITDFPGTANKYRSKFLRFLLSYYMCVCVCVCVCVYPADHLLYLFRYHCNFLASSVIFDFP